MRKNAIRDRKNAGMIGMITLIIIMTIITILFATMYIFMLTKFINFRNSQE